MSLILKNIVKDFETPNGPFRAVDNVSFEIPEGTFCTLLGPSGCGKTTLLRMIAGFEKPTSGDIELKGKRLNEIPPNKRGFSMVFQSYALFPHMTVMDNIAYGLKIKKMEPSLINKKVNEAVDTLNLRGHETKYPSQMSGGQQQRVALARALVMEPEVILFDEPLSNLDAKLRIFMREEIRRLQRRLGITAIYVTHDQEEAMAVSDKVVVLNEGNLAQEGAPTEIYHRPNNQFVADFVGEANIVDFDGKLLGVDYGLQGGNKLMFRPEFVKLSKDSGKHEAKVKSSQFLGARTHYTLDCNGSDIFADVYMSATSEVFAEGSSVRFDIDEKAIHFIEN